MNVSRAGFIKGLFASAALAGSAVRASADGLGSEAELAGREPWTAAPKAGQGPLRFAVIGDNTGLARPGVFDQAMSQVGWLQPDFVLSVGDLVEGYTEDKAEIGRQWQAIEHSVAKLGCPFLFAPGNHDMNTPASVELWRERRGAAYYAFTYKGALFLVLNTEDPALPMPQKLAQQFYQMVDLMKKDPDQVEKALAGFMSAAYKPGPAGMGAESEGAGLNEARFSDKQLAFVRETLARHPASSVRWTFVVMHKPAWKTPTPALAKIQAMLGERPYTVFAGHTHYFTHDVLDGRDYINMATTGGIRHEAGVGNMDHAMLVTLGPTGPFYANLRLNGLMDVAGQTGQVRAY